MAAQWSVPWINRYKQPGLTLTPGFNQPVIGLTKPLRILLGQNGL